MANVREHHFFRTYAFHNKMEFFAVAVEHFFETPACFKNDIPELYKIMCQMLNQDPTVIYPAEKNKVEVKLNVDARKDPDDTIPSDQPHQT